jgi:hypothetical protein
MEGHMDAVARTDGFTLTVEHAAELLAGASEEAAPPLPEVIDRVADLWIGYTALAAQLITPDTFSGLDLTPLTKIAMDQEVVWLLRDAVVVSSAGLTEEEMEQQYERDPPFARADVQHILIRIPTTASQADVDSLRDVAEAIRRRVLEGEDFDELARLYSEDPSSAPQGGRLGWVDRGRLVPEIDAIIFDIEPGAISETTRTTFGFHIVRANGHEIPNYEEVREAYAAYLSSYRLRDVERAYVDSLFAASDVRLTGGSINMVRSNAFSNRVTRLSAVERGAALVRYRGGEVTVGEWADVLVRGRPNLQGSFSNPDSAAVAELLHSLVRNELLAKAAYDLGLEVPEETADSVIGVAKGDLFGSATASGFRRRLLIDSQADIGPAVDRMFRRLAAAQIGPRMMDRISPALKRGRPFQVYTYRFRAAAERMAEIRAARGQGESRE